MPPIVVALFLVAHGLIHVSFVSPAPPARPGAPRWPFDLAHSWVLNRLGLDATTTRRIGAALLVAVLIGYFQAALGVLGILPGPLFLPGIVVGSVASIVLLALFFHPWLILGLVIDAVLLGAALLNGWRPGDAAL